MRLLPAFVLASVLTVGSLYVSVSVEVEQECETSADGEVTCTDAPAASNSTADDDSDCVDKHEKCEGWNNARQCYGDNANFMLRECPKSCGVCGKSEQYDDPGPTEDMCSYRPQKRLYELVSKAKFDKRADGVVRLAVRPLKPGNICEKAIF